MSEQPVQQSSAGLPRMRDPQFREMYSNSALTTLGPFDIAITFQKTSEIAPNQLGTIDLISVTMSPQHFKGLVRSLSATLEAYEHSFGRLTISDEDTKPIRSASELEGLIEGLRAGKASPSLATEPPRPSKRSRAASPKKAPEP